MRPELDVGNAGALARGGSGGGLGCVSRLHEPVPQYDAFWNGNKTFCREVVGCLFGADVALFVRTCSQPALRAQCTAYARACDRELARLRDVCGLELQRFRAGGT